MMYRTNARPPPTAPFIDAGLVPRSPPMRVSLHLFGLVIGVLLMVPAVVIVWEVMR